MGKTQDWIGDDLANLLELPNQVLYSLYETYYSGTRRDRKATIRRIANNYRLKYRKGFIVKPEREHPYDKDEPKRISARRAKQLGAPAVHAETLPDVVEPVIDPQAELAIEFLSAKNPEHQNLLEMYESFNDQVVEIEIKTNKPSAKVLYLNELLIGHKDSAIQFFARVVDKLPEDLDAIVLSGVLQGDFKLLQKARRKSLVPELASMDTQFHYAKQIIDKLVESGIPVIYNLSNDDRRVAEEYTIESFRKMLDLANSVDKVNYYQIDKMKTHPKWQEHLNFQTAIAYPYCLRSGRRLRSAEEMKELTGEHSLEEYLMLFDVVKDLEEGKEPNPEYTVWLEMENLGDTTFRIVDDANVNFKTKNGKFTSWVRHNLSFSNEPMYGNHLQTPLDIIGQRKASSQSTPEMLITQHNLEEVGIQKDGTWIISCGGLLETSRFMNTKGSKADVAGDQSRRINTTRRRISSPSASIHERFDDGRHIVTILNEKLLNKAESCPRTALPLLTDWQIGSLSARPDLLIKYLDYIQSINEEKILYLNGDFVQGRNYANFPNENQSLGLISMDSQVAFVRELLDKFLHAEGVTKALVTPGNHEWNSGTEKWHGYSFTQYIMDALSAKNIPNQRSEGMMTAKGEQFKAWASIDYVGDYGVYVSHLPLMKGAKGNSGPPIYQAATHTTGLGEAKQSVDFEMYGHWHHPQYLLFGDKLSVISGSLAGMSGYEWMRGYRPIISSVILHIGGSEAPQLEFLSQDFMENWKVTGWTNSQIKKFVIDATKRASEGVYTKLK